MQMYVNVRPQTPIVVECADPVDDGLAAAAAS
jgi:hypothetical protein